MSSKFCYLDFEYNRTTHPKLHLVSCSTILHGETEPRKWWLCDENKTQTELAKFVYDLHCDGYIFVAFAVTAEARSFLSLLLPIPVCKFKWIDLYLEYRCLLNHSEITYGRHLIDGKVVTTRKPLYGEDGVNNSKPDYNLASAVYKFLQIRIDTEEKEAVRDLILSDPPYFSHEERERILNYNASDIIYLPRLFDAMVRYYKKLLLDFPEDFAKLKDEMLLRGDYAARTAMMEEVGYPIDYEATRNFSKSVGSILSDLARDINSQFTEFKPFRYNLKDGSWSMNQKNMRDFIRTTPYEERWELTDGGASGNKDLSLSLEAWTKFFDYKHDYPRGNYGAQIVRYLKTKQSMNGFMPPKKGRKNFWDSVGPDGMVRPYFGIYGAQSSRSQPSATGFIPLKAAWMRALIVPPKGKAIASIDYASQEFLLSALVSEDQPMIDAYASGDVYVFSAKQWGIIPEEGTKKTHPIERQIVKGTVLGIGYSMSKIGLAIKLTQDTGEEVTEKEAQKYIDLFNKTYNDYYKWKDDMWEGYQADGHVKLPDGWYCWGENDNKRSLLNLPIQGIGACIMRKAVALAQDAGLTVTFTLHDAIYIMYDSFDFKAIDTLEWAMREAVRFYFPKDERAMLIRMDAETWSPDYKGHPKTIATKTFEKVAVEEIHIDERAEKEYKNFSKYFKRNEGIDLL